MIDNSDVKVCFRLYVAGQAPNSQRAIANLNAFCLAHLAGCHVIEIVDVMEHPGEALANRVFLTPQLVIASPLPAQTIVGDLSDSAVLSARLGRVLR
jgi:circadian clock protein KaiB